MRAPQLHHFLTDLLPGRMAVNARERWRAVGGAALGMALTAWLCHAFGPAGSSAWLVAPMGASAVLVFAVPASPMAQPWAVVGGNTLSALVGVACVNLFGAADWVAAAAVGGAIATMFALRCLHPPGGASALLMVLAGVQDPRFALFPVLGNALLLVAAGMAYNTATGRRYPHGQRALAPAGPGAQTTAADVDAALARYNQVLDVSPDDLQQLIAEAEAAGYQRRMGRLTCADVMSPNPLTAEYATPLQDAWAMLRRHRIKALPVVDTVRRVIGVVTLADFMRDPTLDTHAGWADRLHALLRPTRTVHTDKAEAVGQIMTSPVQVAYADQPAAELLPMFATTGHHHIPVVDAERRLVGILTQSDLVAALCHSGAESVS